MLNLGEEQQTGVENANIFCTDTALGRAVQILVELLENTRGQVLLLLLDVWTHVHLETARDGSLHLVQCTDSVLDGNVLLFLFLGVYFV
jgi:hypothetical protein